MEGYQLLNDLLFCVHSALALDELKSEQSTIASKFRQKEEDLQMQLSVMRKQLETVTLSQVTASEGQEESLALYQRQVSELEIQNT